MQIGEVIRKYRKQKELTQEEMGERLGVTAPAVNKWENGNSLPDITLLSPIARLLGISLEELLSFREDLTKEEIRALILELGERMKDEGYVRAFRWAKERIQEYPGSEELALSMGQMLNAYRITETPEDPSQYDTAISGRLERSLESGKEENRRSAAGSLFHIYFGKGQYEKAEKYLDYFSEQNPEYKRLKAAVYEKTGRLDEAYQAYEELLYSYYTMVTLVLHNLYSLSLSQGERERAVYLAEKQAQNARLFDMGEYSALAPELELAVLEKDQERCLDLLEQLLESIDGMYAGLCSSPLYEHIKFRKVEEGEEMREFLKKNLQGDAELDFLKDSPRWKKLIGNANP